ncbi:MAG: hypothetical protein ACFCUN_13285 [Hyphomicrobiaceae bacterium]
MIALFKCAVALLFVTVASSAMAFNDRDKVKDHLEFLGYTVSQRDNGSLRATHKSDLDISVKEFQGGILVTSYFSGKGFSSTQRPQVLDIINKMNVDAIAVRYYLDSDADLIIEGYYGGDYARPQFATFIDKFKKAREQIIATPGLADYFK